MPDYHEAAILHVVERLERTAGKHNPPVLMKIAVYVHQVVAAGRHCV
jgi:hypothetical protein